MDKNNEIKHKIVETYAEDMATAIKDNKGGLIKKIIHSEEKHEKEKINFSPESRRNKFFMFASFIFIVIGIMILSFFLSTKEVSVLPVEDSFVPLIFHDKSVFSEVKDFKKEEIAQTVSNEVTGTEVKNGGIEGIYLMSDKKLIGLREFITLIKSNLVVDNNPVLVSDNFLMGVANMGSKDFFMLLKVRLITDIFDSLRAWERKMFFDLHGFFGIALSSETKYLLTKDFEDGIIENKNARLLYDKEGKIVMMYVYADNNSVVITNTKNTTHEIMLRLAGSKIKK